MKSTQVISTNILLIVSIRTETIISMTATVTDQRTSGVSEGMRNTDTESVVHTLCLPPESQVKSKSLGQRTRNGGEEKGEKRRKRKGKEREKKREKKGGKRGGEGMVRRGGSH